MNWFFGEEDHLDQVAREFEEEKERIRHTPFDIPYTKELDSYLFLAFPHLISRHPPPPITDRFYQLYLLYHGFITPELFLHQRTRVQDEEDWISRIPYSDPEYNTFGCYSCTTSPFTGTETVPKLQFIEAIQPYLDHFYTHQKEIKARFESGFFVNSKGPTAELIAVLADPGVDKTTKSWLGCLNPKEPEGGNPYMVTRLFAKIIRRTDTNLVDVVSFLLEPYRDLNKGKIQVFREQVVKLLKGKPLSLSKLFQTYMPPPSPRFTSVEEEEHPTPFDLLDVNLHVDHSDVVVHISSDTPGAYFEIMQPIPDTSPAKIELVDTYAKRAVLYIIRENDLKEPVEFHPDDWMYSSLVDGYYLRVILDFLEDGSDMNMVAFMLFLRGFVRTLVGYTPLPMDDWEIPKLKDEEQVTVMVRLAFFMEGFHYGVEKQEDWVDHYKEMLNSPELQQWIEQTFPEPVQNYLLGRFHAENVNITSLSTTRIRYGVRGNLNDLDYKRDTLLLFHDWLVSKADRTYHTYDYLVVMLLLMSDSYPSFLPVFPRDVEANERIQTLGKLIMTERWSIQLPFIRTRNLRKLDVFWTKRKGIVKMPLEYDTISPELIRYIQTVALPIFHVFGQSPYYSLLGFLDVSQGWMEKKQRELFVKLDFVGSHMPVELQGRVIEWIK